MSEFKQKSLIYCRVSSERQKNEGNGLDSQEHRCREYAKSKGYEVELVFKDSFTGGGDFMKREGMPDLLAYLEKYPHRSYVVIFDDLKRMARDTVFYLKLRQMFKVLGAKLESPNFTFEESDEAMFVETVLASAAELERKQNKRQVIQKMKARLEKGLWPFYPPPGYYSVKEPLHGKVLVPDDKGKIIKEAFEGFASSRFKDQEDVRKFLKEKDFCDGRPVYLSFVKRLLTRVIYAGYIEYPDWEVSRRLGEHEPIIGLDVFERVQDRLNGKARCFTRKDTNPDFPLRGPVLCSGCQKPLTASWSTSRKKNKHPYYRCNQPGCPVKNKSIKKSLIEDAMCKLLKRVKPKKQILDYTEALFLEAWKGRMANIDKANLIKQRELAEIMAEKQSHIQRIPKTKIEAEIESYEKRIEELSQKELRIKEEITNPKVRGISFETALETVLAYVGNPYDKWENGSLNDKRLVLKLVFTDRLLYDREKGFGTAQLSLPMKAFELFSTSNSKGVEMWGIEPQSEIWSKGLLPK